MLQIFEVAGYTCNKLRFLSQNSLVDVELPVRVENRCCLFNVILFFLYPLPSVKIVGLYMIIWFLNKRNHSFEQFYVFLVMVNSWGEPDQVSELFASVSINLMITSRGLSQEMFRSIH